MSKARKILFIGDSHTHAVQSALRTQDAVPPGFEIEAHRLAMMKNGKAIGTLSAQDLFAYCKTMDEDDLVVSLFRGNVHAMLSLVQHDQPFDILEAGESSASLRDGAEVVPRSSVKALFSRELSSKECLRVKEVAEAGRQKTVHMSAPPPKSDDKHILQRFETQFVEKGLAEKGISPAVLRRKFWTLQNETLAELLAEAGIDLLPPPDGTMTDDGFLRPEYYADDATHANSRYGLRLIQQAVAFISTGAA